MSCQSASAPRQGRREAFAAARQRLEEQTGRSEQPQSEPMQLDPEFIATKQGRRAWHREANKQLMAKRELAAKPIPRDRAARLLESIDRLEENHQVEIQASAAYEQWWTARAKSGLAGNRVGMAPKPFTPTPEPEGQINKTDPDSRMMMTVGQPTGQSYNAQAAVTRDQIIVAAEISVQSPDFGHLQPTLDAALRDLKKAAVPERPEIVLADAGYWHQDQIEAIVSDGIQVLVPPDGGLRRGTRPGWDKGMYRFMRSVLAGEHGSSLYKHRKATIEPVFGQIKHNRKITRFQRRGRSAARSEWRLIAATHNLMKLHNHQITALG